MKRILIGLLTVGCLAFAAEAQAQDFASLSKQEKKALKKELRKLSVEEYYDMKQMQTSMSSDIEALRSELTGKEDQLSTARRQNSELQSDLADAQAALQDAQAKLAARPPQPQPQPEPQPAQTRVEQGVMFKVQIGAFRQKDLSKYFDNHPNFGGEYTDEGAQQITLGQFRNYWEADQFKKYLREMGVKDAWIVPYRDGERVPLKDVLEGIIQ